MNAITPENEIPPAHNTAASGTFPTEQTNDAAATSGPTSTSVGPQKSALKKPIGSSAMNPAMRKPPTISFQSIAQSLRKLCATSDHASTERSFEPDSAETCTCPACAATACSRACASSARVTN